MVDLLKLQNGSDVRGVAAEGVEGEPVTLTPQAVNLIGQAFARWLSGRSGKEVGDLKIGVGHDSRITAEQMKTAFISGLSAAGAAVYDCGLVSTPSMFMTVVFPEFSFDGSVMITASHLPFNRNGLKFFNPDGGLEKSDIKEILTLAKTLTPADSNQKALPCESLAAYTRSLREKIREGVQAEDYSNPLKGLHIVVDAGNGAGGFFVSQVLAPLGADTSGSQFLEPDGMFPNHIPNPENHQAMESIKQAVLNHHADLGIIFDTDVDRMSAVLPDGSEVNRDAIIAMMAAILAKDYPGGTIVTDSVTSDRLTRFLEQELKLTHHRFKRGYKNVINESRRLNAEGVVSPLAIETSGHGALSENYFLDDGAYMAVKLLIAAALAAREGKQIGSFIEKLEKGFEEREYRMKLTGEDFTSYGQNVLTQFEERAKAAGYAVAPNSYEGVRISFDSEQVQGWLLLRLSLHDPLMPLNMEGVRPGDCEQMAEIVRRLLTGFENLEVI
ncbi:MAG: phosphomannomutase/phosphoglucomutase [Lachnospiraceae bacterium]|nr:phosphomannomutase/phosphoglucomutase [Lachnospiraceae bacterium]MCI9133821.1 phosphomannomutase/phosphoglucomutase [Lachnospiraceae bacterium]